MLEELVQAVVERRAILFVGAGVSAELGVPTWRELMAHIGGELEYDPDIFIGPDANYLILAEYYKIIRGSIGPLLNWMDKEWNVSEEKLRESRVHDLMVSLDFPIIYTTNYDENIENAFKARGRDVAKIVDVGDIAKANANNTQVVKLHGDFTSDASIVLTEADYFDRLSFESPLDIKLRSDALAKTVLFIGYSLTDLNVRLLLYKLWRTWNASGHKLHRPKSYIFLARPDIIHESVLAQWDINAITEDVDNPGDALRSFLERLQRSVNEVRAVPR